MAIVHFDTSLGTFSIELDTAAAPLTCENFIRYAREDFFTGTLFHRVIDNFMVQGGGLTADMRNKAPIAPPIENEAGNGLLNVRGSVAMARTADPHSATSQFFINLVDNDFLNHRAKTGDGWGYAVFGQVCAGMDTVDAIRQVKTGNYAGHRDVPMEPILINACRIAD